MADKNINNVSAVSSVNDTDTIHITTGNTFAQVSVSTLIAKAKADTLTQVEASLLDKLTNGCFIVYHETGQKISHISSWTTLQNGGKVADGVLLIEGGHAIVIAPTESASTLKWSSSNVGVLPSKYIPNIQDAFSDFSGYERTQAALANETIGGDGAGYAPGFCAAYSQGGKAAGEWWLPSVGEALMIRANRFKINVCLELINGATLISASQYMTSTEINSSSYWVVPVNATSGNILNPIGKAGPRTVRAVSTIYNN